MTMYRIVWRGVTVMETGNEALAREVAAEAKARVETYFVPESPYTPSLFLIAVLAVAGYTLAALLLPN